MIGVVKQQITPVKVIVHDIELMKTSGKGGNMSDASNFTLVIGSILILAILFRSLFNMNGPEWKWWGKIILFFAVGIASITYCISFVNV